MLRYTLLLCLVIVTSATLPAQERSAAMRSASATSGSSKPPEPLSVSGFELPDPGGKPVELKPNSTKQFTVVCFLGTECPMARAYGPRLSKLAVELADRPVRFIGINSNSQDSAEEVAAFAREYGVTFPLVKDPGNKVADQFGAQRMAEVFVVDPSLTIRYRGRVDDQYQPGVTRGEPTRHDLRVALEELLAGKMVSVSKTEVTGCFIGRIQMQLGDAPKTTSVTYCRQVSRILNQHCVECHREGEIGPFSLSDYKEITGWGETILETVDSGRMPPWNATSEHRQFRNARNLPESDKQTLREWFKAGMPYGDAADLPEPPKFTSGWQLGRDPDLVVKMRDKPFHVPASGTVEYQYFVVDPHFETDKWVSASQVIPGNRPTVHHGIVFVRPPDGSDVRGVGYLSGYVPGQRSFRFPPGYARKVPAGSKFVFQMHYTPNGIEQDDLTQIGMTFIPDSEVTHEVITLLGIDQEFEIPPYASSHPVSVTLGWFPRQAELLAIVPHMHVRGKSFQAVSRVGGKTEVLLDVPRYDFNWQHVYELSTPIKLSTIDQLGFTARFDNSKANPVNPDPSQTVTWGDQTWEEMAIAFFEVAEPRGSAEPEPQRNKRKLVIRDGAEHSTSNSSDAFANDFFARFDKNKDGFVEKHETPLSFRTYGFRHVDLNGDERITRDEVITSENQQRKRKS